MKLNTTLFGFVVAAQYTFLPRKRSGIAMWLSTAIFLVATGVFFRASLLSGKKKVRKVLRNRKNQVLKKHLVYV